MAEIILQSLATNGVEGQRSRRSCFDSIAGKDRGSSTEQRFNAEVRRPRQPILGMDHAGHKRRSRDIKEKPRLLPKRA